MTRLSVGTHNLHDYAGLPTPFAELIGFTEAIPSVVAAALKHAGYKTVFVLRQRDLVIAYDPKVLRKVGIARYKLAHRGRKEVTPHRGTLKVAFEVIATGERIDVFLEHRINAGFPPFVRGEAHFRATKWKGHTELTLDWMQQSVEKGHRVIGFGDVNTPHGVRGYKGFDEVGRHFDRLAGDGFRFHHVAYLSNMKSDHPRLRAVADATGKTWVDTRFDEAA